MADENDLISVAARIQEAAWHENGRSEIIRTICEHVGSVGGVFMDFDYAKNEFVHISTFGLPTVQQSYLEEIFENPELNQDHTEYSLSHHSEHTITDYDLMSEEQIRKDGFYDWLERSCHVKYFIGSRLRSGGPNGHLLGLHYTKEQGHANEDQVRHTSLLRSHLANAFRIAALREQLDDARSFSAFVEARLPYGLVGLDQRGRCISINEMAERIFSQDDGITVGADGQLLIADPSSSARVERQIGMAVHASEGGDLFAGGEEIVTRTSRRGNYLVKVTPGLRLRYGYDVGVPVVMITISDPESRSLISRNKLSDLFGLTNREAEVVHHMLSGKGLPYVAKAMGISHNTARVHLRNVFAKTGCSSQSEVISKLGRLL